MQHSLSVEQVRAKYLIENLSVEHCSTEPVMLLGQARSGTTVICAMMRKYLKVNFGPESQFIPRIYRQIERYGDLQDDDNFRRLINSIIGERCFELNQFGFKPNLEQLISDQGNRSYSNLVDAIFTQFAEHNDMVRWGDNTPAYVHELPILYDLFPRAKYIHIVRDGRDVALSCFEQYFGPNNATVAGLEWSSGVEKVRDFAAGLNASQFYEIRYEDLLNDPVESFKRIACFLEVKEEREWQERLEEGLPGELKAGNFSKWKQKFSKRQSLAFERAAGRQLRDCGYECVAPVVNPPGAVMKKLAYIHHHLKKYTNIKAWKDDYYKVGLRLKSLLND